MFLAPQVGLEPTTLRLTAECSAIELLRNVCFRSLKNVIIIPPRLALVNPFFAFFSTFLLFCFFFHHKGPTWAKSSRNTETFPVEEGTALRVISFYLQTGCYRLMLVHHRKRQHANDFPIIPTHPSYFLSVPFSRVGITLHFCTKSRISARKHAWDAGCTLAGFSAYML